MAQTPRTTSNLPLSPAAPEALQLGYTGPIRTTNTWSGTISGQVAVQFNSDLRPAAKIVDGASVSNSYDPDLLLTQAGNLAITRDPASGSSVTRTTLGNVTDQRTFGDRGIMTNYTAFTNGRAGLGHDVDLRLD